LRRIDQDVKLTILYDVYPDSELSVELHVRVNSGVEDETLMKRVYAGQTEVGDGDGFKHHLRLPSSQRSIRCVVSDLNTPIAFLKSIAYTCSLRATAYKFHSEVLSDLGQCA
jgi:hypothetical protein